MSEVQSGRGKLHGEALRVYVTGNIDRAVTEGWIKVFYQPVARTLTGEICGMEALARWDDPVYGLLAPDEFVSALEEARLIHKLDSCIIQNVCREYTGFMEDECNVTVSFNLSRLDFGLCDIHSVIEEAIRINKIPRDALRIEITESVMETNEERMQDVIDRFWERGLRVWMDDFGSGYSSLNVLKDYNFETLKIDMVFLRNYDIRSQEIVKSVVDMAKRIGVHTLAEGVETSEQFEFLKKIGCEKAQGFYIGRPMPYKECMAHLKEKGFRMESSVKRQYYHDIGRVNVLSATPQFSNEEAKEDETYRDQQLPIAFVEFSQRRIHYLFANENYRATLKQLGYQSTEEVERDFGHGDTAFGARFLSMLQKAKETGKVASLDFVRGSNYCYAQVRTIAGYPGGNAFLCILQNLSRDTRMHKNLGLSEQLQNLCTIYDRIELVDLNSGLSENLYQSRQTKNTYNRIPAGEELIMYAEDEIYPEDREEFRDFVNLDTIEQRLMESPTQYISAPFRTRTENGSYVWELYCFLFSGDKSERKILSCSSRMNSDMAAILHENELSSRSVRHTEEDGLTPGVLWENYIMHSDTAFFWKDKDRRFMGVNRKFLEYYGLESEDELIGKTDEDMGWHVKPDPYQQDEERIIKHGEQTYQVPGTCICKGEIKDIVASKMPIYNHGEIVGLMGYFQDITEQKLRNIDKGKNVLNDQQTGVLNFLGLVDSMLHYQEGYLFEGKDFAMICLDIEQFHSFNASYGMEAGNKLLKKVAECLKALIGVTGVAGRLNSDHFLILKQFQEAEEINRFLQVINKQIAQISDVDGIPCEIGMKEGYALYSEANDLQQLFLLAEERIRMQKSGKGAVSLY